MHRAAALVIVGALCALLPGCWTLQALPGNCENVPPFNNAGVFSASELAALGNMAIVAKDGSISEVNITCVQMSFDEAEGFNLSYKNSLNNTVVTLNGKYTTAFKNFTIEEGPNPVFLDPGIYSTQSISLGTWNNTAYPRVLGDGKLYPTFISPSLVLFKTCTTQSSLVIEVGTYVGVPLSKAKDNTACNCDWTTLQ